MDNQPRIRFLEDGTELKAVEIHQRGNSPVISKLQRALSTLGIGVSTYRVKCVEERLVERLVLERGDGHAVTGELRVRTRAAVLPVVFSKLDGAPYPSNISSSA